MDFKHLRYVVAVAQEKNITKAAEKLFISQSSLSYTLSTVEKEIGMPLFLRSKNGVELTAAGQRYCAAAQKMLTIYADLQKDLRESADRQHINIATSSVWGARLFSELIPAFRRHHPGTTFNLTQAEMFYLMKELDDDSQDFAFVSLSPYDKLPHNAHLLYHEPMRLVVPVSHPYAQHNTGDVMHLDELEPWFGQSSFVLSRPGSSCRVVLDHVFEAHSFKPANIFEVNGLDLMRMIVSQGNDVAMLPVSGCAPDPNIHYYDIEPPVYRYNVFLCKPQSNYNDTQKAFYRFVLNYFRKKYGAGPQTPAAPPKKEGGTL